MATAKVDIQQIGGVRGALIARFALLIVVLTGPVGITFGAPLEIAPVEQTSAQRIEGLIEQLGHDDYLVRQSAQEKLAEFGFEACDALAVASAHQDLEIASRAKYLLRLIQVEWIVPSDAREVKAILTDFGRLPFGQRWKRIWYLARLPNGQGVVALCRVVRFEKSSVLSQSAALEILKLEPFDADLRRQRAQLLVENLAPSRRTAANWVITHSELRQNPQAPLSKWTKLVEAARADVPGATAGPNDRALLWLLYHQAILAEDRGEHDTAKKSVAAAGIAYEGLRPDLLKVHLDIASTLQRWGFFDWAEAEYRRVIDAGLREPRGSANFALAQMKHDRGQHKAAADVIKAAIDIIQKEGQARRLGDISSVDAAFRGRMNYYLSCHCEQQGDVEKQRKHVDLALKADPAEIDALIARHRLPPVDEEYRRKTDLMIKNAADRILEMIRKTPDEPQYLNHWAWLIGNTDGDLNKALEHVQAALKISPNNGAYLDTMAHVYFARGEYEKAVETQEEAVRFEPHSGLIAEKLKLFRDKLEEQPAGKKKPDDINKEGPGQE